MKFSTMKFVFLTLTLVLFLVVSACCQQHKEVVLYLKGGSAIVGRIMQGVDTVKIQTYDSSIWAFPKSEIDSVVFQKATDPNVRYKKRGFVHYTELGPLAMSNRASNGVTTSAFSFQITNGYKFNQWIYTGLGVGADLYAVQTFVPLVVSLRGDFVQKGTKIPFYFAEAGYGFNATSNDLDDVRFGGGATGAAGLGLKILFNGNTGFTIAMGYRYQRSSITESGVGITENFNRLTLRAGFSF